MSLRTSKKGLPLKGPNCMLRAGSTGMRKQTSWSSTMTKRHILRSLNVLRSLGEGKETVMMNRNIA
ncbi:hypothetical protein CJF30_00011159 [Rutstroemia sp. NJR-2017a BBW]|nr:hypothetical protein CJF30_00011159 [Rutstroemia sp. NJR-2017a BBW]